MSQEQLNPLAFKATVPRADWCHTTWSEEVLASSHDRTGVPEETGCSLHPSLLSSLGELDAVMHMHIVGSSCPLVDACRGDVFKSHPSIAQAALTAVQLLMKLMPALSTVAWASAFGLAERCKAGPLAANKPVRARSSCSVQPIHGWPHLETHASMALLSARPQLVLAWQLERRLGMRRLYWPPAAVASVHCMLACSWRQVLPRLMKLACCYP